MNNRVTRGASFNRANPADVALLAWLDAQPSPSEAIKNALRLATGQPAEWSRPAPELEPLTSQEVGNIITELAGLKQRLEQVERNQVNGSRAVSTETPQADTAPASGLELRPEFLLAVKKAAKPGIRLGD